MPDTEESDSVYHSCSRAIAPSVTWRGKHSQPRIWLRRWKKAPWLKHLSGATLNPSTADHGVAKFISSLPDSPVNHIPALARKRVRQMIDGSGRISPELFARPGLLPFSLRMYEDSSEVVSLSSSAILPPSGIISSGVVSKHQIFKHPTKETDCLSWGTPKVATGAYQKSKGKITLNLEGQVKEWALPRATPTARDWRDGATDLKNVEVKSLLGRQCIKWTKDYMDSLPEGVWKTILNGCKSSGLDIGSSPRPSLNPLFVSWLMGVELTHLGLWEMDVFHIKWRTLSRILVFNCLRRDGLMPDDPKVYSFSIAGVTMNDRQTILRRLRTALRSRMKDKKDSEEWEMRLGQIKTRVRPEPENEFDNDALAIDVFSSSRGWLNIGYVPKKSKLIGRKTSAPMNKVVGILVRKKFITDVHLTKLAYFKRDDEIIYFAEVTIEYETE